MTAATSTAIDPSAIPSDLRARDQWAPWRQEARGGKLTKVPINIHRTPHYVRARVANRIRNAKVNDPATWTTFEAARAYAVANDLPGVGYFFTDADGYTGIDQDKCGTRATGHLEPYARARLDQLDSYSEWSISGTGVKTIIRATLPPGRRRTGNGHARHLEMYDTVRFFALTGHHVAGTPTSIEDRQAEVDELHAATFATPQAQPAAPLPSSQAIASDDDVLAHARAARNSDRFNALWHGSTSDQGGDASAADLALCSHLAFYTQDPAQIDRLFRQSGLMRDKWNRPDYRDRTIRKGMERSAYYTPPAPTADTDTDVDDAEPPADAVGAAAAKNILTAIKRLVCTGADLEITASEQLVAIYDVIALHEQEEAGATGPLYQPVALVAKRTGVSESTVKSARKKFGDRGAEIVTVAPPPADLVKAGKAKDYPGQHIAAPEPTSAFEARMAPSFRLAHRIRATCPIKPEHKNKARKREKVAVPTPTFEACDCPGPPPVRVLAICTCCGEVLYDQRHTCTKTGSKNYGLGQPHSSDAPQSVAAPETDRKKYPQLVVAEPQVVVDQRWRGHRRLQARKPLSELPTTRTHCQATVGAWQCKAPAEPGSPYCAECRDLGHGGHTEASPVAGVGVTNDSDHQIVRCCRCEKPTSDRAGDGRPLCRECVTEKMPAWAGGLEAAGG